MERNPLRALCPLIAIAAAVFLTIEFCQSDSANRGTRCLFPCETVYVGMAQNNWMFRGEQSTDTAGLQPVQIYCRTEEVGSWRNPSLSEFYWVRDSEAIDPKHAADFLPSLEQWLANDNAQDHSRALQAVRALRKAGTAYSPSTGFQLQFTAHVGLSVVHTPVTALAVIFGAIASLVWVDDAVKRRRIRAWRALNCCPRCGYDIRGLRDPTCPECGAAINKP